MHKCFSDWHVVGGRPRVSDLDGTKRLRLWSAHSRLFNKRWALSKISEPFDQPALWATPRKLVQQESWQQQEQLPRPRCRPVIPGCTCSVSLNECEAHGCPIVTLDERRGTLHLVVNSASKSTLSSPARAALAPAPNCNVTRFVLNLTTLWRLRLLIRHAVETLCVRIPRGPAHRRRDCDSIDLSCQQPDDQHRRRSTRRIAHCQRQCSLSQTCRDANGERMVLDCSPRQHDCPLTRTWRAPWGCGL